MYCRIIALVVATLLAAGIDVARADEGTTELLKKHALQAGMLITGENANLAKGLVPESFLDRVHKGQYALRIGELDPPDALSKVLTKAFYEQTEKQVGKYDVDEYGGIVEKATGQRPWPMASGLPYPKLDLAEDPVKLGTKIAWNFIAVSGTYNEFDAGTGWAFSAPVTGPYTRYFLANSYKQYLEFRPEPITIDRPLQYHELNSFLEPTEAFGTMTLTWRWVDPTKADSVWAYAPSSRRLRRISAANRSDAILGTEFTTDDNNLYGGKIESFQWKFVREQDMLMPFLVPLSVPDDVYKLKLPMEGVASTRYSKQGAFQVKERKKRVWSWDEKEQKLAGWFLGPPAVLWVPVSGYVVEAYPKDSNYNYGKQLLWFQKDTYAGVHKEIYNRAGEYFRTLTDFTEFVRYVDPAGKEHGAAYFYGFIHSDETVDRGVLFSRDAANGGGYGQSPNYNVGWDPDSFSHAKFLQFGK